MQKLVLLELNEVNFDYINRYIAKGRLPAFAKLIENYGVAKTESESAYAELEPWIQWVTAHTGLSLSEHGLFRLGDIHNSDVRQIWEHLEKEFGCKVGAISPMNAANRTQMSPFFVPDPWTGGEISGPRSVERLYDSISLLVNDNASGRAGLIDMIRIGVAVFRYGGQVSWRRYINGIAGSITGKWRRAIVLDLLLTDLFLASWEKSKPEFSSLFLNGGAHIQHHYLFNSSVYEGNEENPNWYVPANKDPVLEIYELYDKILSTILSLPDVRLMVATGLHQDPHDKVTYYYRLREHKEFLSKVGVEDFEVFPRMSRDFLLRFASVDSAEQAANILESAESESGERVFSVDNRGGELFCMLIYPNIIDEKFSLLIKGEPFDNFFSEVSFVAIKNGQHNGVGYFVDTGDAERLASVSFPLAEVFDRIVRVFEDPKVVQETQ